MGRRREGPAFQIRWHKLRRKVAASNLSTTDGDCHSNRRGLQRRVLKRRAVSFRRVHETTNPRPVRGRRFREREKTDVGTTSPWETVDRGSERRDRATSRGIEARIGRIAAFTRLVRAVGSRASPPHARLRPGFVELEIDERALVKAILLDSRMRHTRR